ncbi:hypothetical protein N7451_005253 [Penicillium sp. IBT 35674x]|nr:hypothetical protein N7451_005253 [Penicillium sp. IBT 35674x]
MDRLSWVVVRESSLGPSFSSLVNVLDIAEAVVVEVVNKASDSSWLKSSWLKSAVQVIMKIVEVGGANRSRQIVNRQFVLPK